MKIALFTNSSILRLISVSMMIALIYPFFAPSYAKAQTNRQLTQENSNSEKRVALVIGNGAYRKAKPLPNPTNDATDMAATLKSLGFEVFSGTNLDKRGMENLIREFGNKLASGGVGLFYYAGHGIQVGGENYLVPVDADIPEEDEVSYAAVPLNLVLAKMNSARNDLNIVVLDACRNNPFARSWRSFRDNSNTDGLAKISPPTGTLVLYATEPGKVASDGAGRNGLFTEALLKQIKNPNLEYDQMVKQLSAEVWQKSNKQQLPWKEGNTLADFYFVKNGAKTNAAKTQPTVSSEKQPPVSDENRASIEKSIASSEENKKLTDQSKNAETDKKMSSVPSNIKLVAALKTPVSTKASIAGDRFTMEVTSPSGYEGAIIEGRVAKTESSKVSGEAVVWLAFEMIRYRSGEIYNFSAKVTKVKSANGQSITVINGEEGKDNKQSDKVKREEIGAALGALINAIGNTKAPSGTVVLLKKSGDSIELRNGTEFELESSAPVSKGNNP